MQPARVAAVVGGGGDAAVGEVGVVDGARYGGSPRAARPARGGRGHATRVLHPGGRHQAQRCDGDDDRRQR